MPKRSKKKGTITKEQFIVTFKWFQKQPKYPLSWEVDSPYYLDPNVVKCPVHGENITPECPDCRSYKFEEI